jgi:hypothetical protein
MNGQVHSTTKKTPFEVVFQSNFVLKNWLTPEERKEARGIQCEDGSWITKDDLDDQVQCQIFEELHRKDKARALDKPIEGVEKGKGKEREPIQAKEVQGTDEEDEGYQEDEEDGEEGGNEEDKVFPGDLQLPIDVDNDDVPPLLEDDEVLRSVQENIAKARDKMVKKYSKNHNIKTFIASDIVTIRLPRDIRTSIDNRRLFARVLGEPKPNRY